MLLSWFAHFISFRLVWRCLNLMEWFPCIVGTTIYLVNSIGHHPDSPAPLVVQVTIFFMCSRNFLCMVFHVLRYIPSLLNILKFWSGKYVIFSNDFLCLLRGVWYFSKLYLLLFYFKLSNISMVAHLCIANHSMYLI